MRELVIVGGRRVGKTTIARKIVGSSDSSENDATLSSEERYPGWTTHRPVKGGEYSLVVHDCAGDGEDEGNVGSRDVERVLMRGNAIVVAYDVTRPASLESAVSIWGRAIDRCAEVAAIRSGGGSSPVVMLLGLKSDAALPGSGDRVRVSDAQRLADSRGWLFLEASGSTGTNVSLALQLLAIRAGDGASGSRSFEDTASRQDESRHAHHLDNHHQQQQQQQHRSSSSRESHGEREESDVARAPAAAAAAAVAFVQDEGDPELSRIEDWWGGAVPSYEAGAGLSSFARDADPERLAPQTPRSRLLGYREYKGDSVPVYGATLLPSAPRGGRGSPIGLSPSATEGGRSLRGGGRFGAEVNTGIDLLVDVDVAGSRWGTVAVRVGDDPAALARSFAEVSGLDASLVPRLARMIALQLEALVAGPRSGTAARPFAEETSGPRFSRRGTRTRTEHQRSPRPVAESRVLLDIDVRLPAARSGRLVVRAGDDPHALAREFCAEHGLASSAAVRIESMILAEAESLRVAQFFGPAPTAPVAPASLASSPHSALPSPRAARGTGAGASRPSPRFQSSPSSPSPPSSSSPSRRRGRQEHARPGRGSRARGATSLGAEHRYRESSSTRRRAKSASAHTESRAASGSGKGTRRRRSRALSRSQRLLFNLDVNIDRSRSGTIAVHTNDKPHVLAAKFAVDRKLSARAEKKLAEMIESSKAAYLARLKGRT